MTQSEHSPRGSAADAVPAGLAPAGNSDAPNPPVDFATTDVAGDDLARGPYFDPGTDDPTNDAAPPQDHIRSFVDDLRDLAADAQTVFEAEKAYQGARLSYAASRGKGVALSFGIAVVLAYFAAIALVVGLLLALAPLLTAWGALALVTIALALGAFLAFRSGTKQLRRMRSYLGPAASAEAAP